MRGRALGELPLREGAALQTGSSRTRVAMVQRAEGRLIVWLEERDAWPPWSARMQDSFLVSNQSVVSEIEYAPIISERSCEFASISIRQRQLSITVPTRDVNGRAEEVPGWEETARLVKVRFSPGEEFTKLLPVNLPAPAAP